jgi:ubiquinone/menaquinone biosynthesis C-methylase UbiE
MYWVAPRLRPGGSSFRAVSWPRTARTCSRLDGITSGMRILDVGCGAGDVSALLAGLVGPDGAVVGVDMDPAVLELARERTAASGLGNVSFVEANLAGLRLDKPPQRYL